MTSKLMASKQLDTFRETSLASYRQMAIALASDEEFPAARISEVCFSAGRTLEDLDHHVGQLRNRRFWYNEATRQPSAARANGREHSANVATLDAEIKKLTREFEAKIKTLSEQLAKAQAAASIEFAEGQGSRTQAMHALRSCPRPEGWDAETRRLAERHGEAREYLRSLNIQLREQLAAEREDMAERTERQLEEVKATIAELDEQLREREKAAKDWRFIDWSPVGEQ